MNLFNIAALSVTGAALNYLLEPALSLILASAVVSGYWRRRAAKEKPYRLRYLLIVSMVLLQSVKNFSENPLPYILADKGSFYSEEKKQVKKELDALIKESRGRILSEDLNLLLSNQRPVFFGCYPPMAWDQKWEPKGLIQDCERGDFKMAIRGALWKKIKGLDSCFEKKFQEQARYKMPDRHQISFLRFREK